MMVQGTLFTPHCKVKRSYPIQLEIVLDDDNSQNEWYLSTWYNIYRDRGNTAKMEQIRAIADGFSGIKRSNFFRRTKIFNVTDIDFNNALKILVTK
jgi:hypothetical protein